MENRDLRKAEKAKRTAQADLIEADAQAAKVSWGSGLAGPYQKQMARRLRREAKKRMSKADRRRGRAICDLQNDEHGGDDE